MEDTVPEGYPVFRSPNGTSSVYYSEATGMFNWAVHTSIDVQNQIIIARIKHVHQLQNLYFALTGEELTVKNG
ncbi:hypothetical protein D3C78_1934400 [compost metagenome]